MAVFVSLTCPSYDGKPQIGEDLDRSASCALRRRRQFSRFL